ncbi:MAG TPA: glutathione S-transferase family protein [Steroidobacteraceae bacterium]|nr:glutathione S-transferase family protein [Steroidobacteraceae bacterium]
MLTLYHWEPNANSGKPMLALAEKGVAYESRYTDLLRFDQHQPEYLKINPDGTIPTLVHDDKVFTESTPIMEYVDEAFDGPPLRPQDPVRRWQMRWWMRFFDSYFAPSLSMIGWSVFVGPAVRDRDRKELEAAIDRIPLEARRIAWRKAMFNQFSEAELTESRRRVLFATGVLERHLSSQPWIAGDSYSLGDINGFNLGYALPLSQPEHCNDQKTPYIMEWLRKIYERPATQATWTKGRTALTSRVTFLKRQS